MMSTGFSGFGWGGGTGILGDGVLNTSGSSSDDSWSTVVSCKVVTVRVEYLVTVLCWDGAGWAMDIGAATPIGIFIPCPGPLKVIVISLPTFDFTGALHLFVSSCGAGECRGDTLWGFARDGLKLGLLLVVVDWLGISDARSLGASFGGSLKFPWNWMVCLCPGLIGSGCWCCCWACVLGDHVCCCGLEGCCWGIHEGFEGLGCELGVHDGCGDLAGCWIGVHEGLGGSSSSSSKLPCRFMVVFWPTLTTLDWRCWGCWLGDHPDGLAFPTILGWNTTGCGCCRWPPIIENSKRSMKMKLFVCNTIINTNTAITPTQPQPPPPKKNHQDSG